MAEKDRFFSISMKLEVKHACFKVEFISPDRKQGNRKSIAANTSIVKHATACFKIRGRIVPVRQFCIPELYNSR